MKSGTRIGAALAVGYVLGRRHKLRMAALLVTVAASGRFTALRAAVAKSGGTMGASGGLLGKMTPQLGGVAEKVRGELVNASKAAAVAAVSNKVESLSDSLHQRAEGIRGPGKPSEDSENEDQEGSHDEPEAEGEPDDEDERESVSARRGESSRSPVSRAGR